MSTHPEKPPLFNLSLISVEVEMRHDFPQVFMGDGATHAQNLPGQHAHQTQGVSPLVLARGGNVHILQSVCVTALAGRLT